MRDFIFKLITGVEKKSLKSEELAIIKKLESIKALKNRDKKYILNSKFRVGVVDVTKSGFGFLEQFDSKNRDLLIEESDLKNARSGDIVLAKQIMSRGRPKAEVELVLHKDILIQVVYTKKINSKIVGIDIKTHHIVHLKESQKSLKKLPPQTILKLDTMHSKVIEVIGILNDPKVDEKISLAMYDKKEEFSKESNREAYSFGDFVDGDMYDERVDLRGYDFCTIDPVSAKDFDDAIYYDKDLKVLFVAIADVCEYVYEMGSIDKEALERGFSIYLPHKSIPMLPRNLSENICSLKPNVDRLAFVFKISFDQNMTVIKEELIEGIINSKRRFNYDEIDEFLEGKKARREVDIRVLKFLRPLQKDMNIIRAKRLEESFDLNSDDVTMILDDNQNLISINVEFETASHKLIEDCMLLANQAAAKMIDRGIYRVHDRPKDSKIDILLSNLADIGVVNHQKHTNIYSLFKQLQEEAEKKGVRKYTDKLIIKAQQSASYSSENIGHFGLGFSHYSHFTSPIRRYSDLLLHRILKSKLKDDKKRLQYQRKDISQVCTKISKLERESARVEWDYKDRKFSRWAKENIGRKFTATVVDLKKTPMAVLEDSECFMARVFVLSHRKLELFEKIEVEIADSDVITKDIRVKEVVKLGEY